MRRGDGPQTVLPIGQSGKPVGRWVSDIWQNNLPGLAQRTKNRRALSMTIREREFTIMDRRHFLRALSGAAVAALAVGSLGRTASASILVPPSAGVPPGATSQSGPVTEDGTRVEPAFHWRWRRRRRWRRWRRRRWWRRRRRIIILL
jgi:hypothetical protein